MSTTHKAQVKHKEKATVTAEIQPLRVFDELNFTETLKKVGKKERHEIKAEYFLGVRSRSLIKDKNKNKPSIMTKY